MRKQLMKGNEAVVKAAVLAGCRGFYGYPITPASEITEAAALYLPQVGGTFLQAESEVAAINMLYGGAAAGVLADAGLVRDRKQGRERIWEVNASGVDEARRFLNQVSATWDRRLESLKRYVED